nr:MAG TPA: hypothetical protein [Caudoviricetes sp.]
MFRLVQTSALGRPNNTTDQLFVGRAGIEPTLRQNYELLEF